MRTIIGLTGVKGSGKTTSFGILKTILPELQEITLANRLKQASAEVFGIPRLDFDDPKVKEKELETPVRFDTPSVEALIRHFGVEPDFEKHVRPHLGKVLHTPRQIAQYVGTEVLRNVDEQIHCKGSVLGLPESGLFVVTDMRFWNEYHFFALNPEVKFVPVYIANRTAEAKASGDTHVSEKYVLEIAKECYQVDNNGDFQNLTEELNRILILGGI